MITLLQKQTKQTPELDDIADARGKIMAENAQIESAEAKAERKVWLKTEHVFFLLLILMLIAAYFAFQALP